MSLPHLSIWAVDLTVFIKKKIEKSLFPWNRDYLGWQCISFSILSPTSYETGKHMTIRKVHAFYPFLAK
jgi:hypothetical protein